MYMSWMLSIFDEIRCFCIVKKNAKVKTFKHKWHLAQNDYTGDMTEFHQHSKLIQFLIACFRQLASNLDSWNHDSDLPNFLAMMISLSILFCWKSQSLVIFLSSICPVFGDTNWDNSCTFWNHNNNKVTW